MRRFFVASACIASLFSVRASHAQTKEKPRRMHLGVGVDAMMHLGSQCEQDLDSQECEEGSIFVPFTFSGSYRALSWLSLGGRFAAASKNTGTGVPRHVSLWQLSFEPRAYPLGDTRIAPFVGLAIGYGSLRETSAQVPEHTTHGSSLLGGALGVDVRVDDWLAVTSELRLVRMDFVPAQSERFDGRSTYYTGKAWISVGLQLVALLPV